jgi:hypothetical protein
MATEFYKRSLITSTPKLNSCIGAWVPYAFICWHDEMGHFSYTDFLNSMRLSFPAEQEAVSCGLSIVPTWMDTAVYTSANIVRPRDFSLSAAQSKLTIPPSVLARADKVIK